MALPSQQGTSLVNKGPCADIWVGRCGSQTGVGAVRSGVMRTSGRFWRPKWITGHLRVPGGSLGLPQPPGMGLGRFGGVWCDSPDRENKTIFG